MSYLEDSMEHKDKLIEQRSTEVSTHEDSIEHRDRLIEHLSKEIATHTKNMMTFRAKINFAVFVGPFVILGSLMVSAKGVPRSITFDKRTTVAAILLLMSYILMACTCAAIERQMWRKCNEWRSVILRLVTNSSEKLKKEDLDFPESVRLGYWLVYVAIIIAFGCAVWLVSRVQIVSP